MFEWLAAYSSHSLVSLEDLSKILIDSLYMACVLRSYIIIYFFNEALILVKKISYNIEHISNESAQTWI